MAAKKTKNISLAKDLHGVLDHYPDINWSAVACRAFRAEIKHRRAQEQAEAEEIDKARLESALERYRGVEKDPETALYKMGYGAGRDYVLDAGERLDLEGFFSWFCDLQYWPPDHTLDTVAGALNKSVEDIVDPHETHYADDKDWSRGFANGAASTWREISERLEKS